MSEGTSMRGVKIIFYGYPEQLQQKLQIEQIISDEQRNI